MNNANQTLSKTKIMIIPGNPPASYFYEAWKKELEHITNNEVIIEYYPSFEKITCSLEYLKEVERFYSKKITAHEKIILIGHSVGGYIALKILEKYHRSIEHCVLLFPFLHSPRFRGKLVLGALNQLNKRKYLKTRLTGLSRSLRWLDEDIQRLTQNEITSGLNFASHEHKTIGRKKNIDINPTLHPKMTLYYTDKDTWCSKKVVKSLHPELNTEWVDVKHHFVTSKAERTIINNRLFTQ
ncbi:MAG: alpha/beta hydrolase [Gammaproteobacteria bacterium]|nr:alpha/beta hydrolase [Gammaproteobacteria bacterium]